jgi:hypothetical protein
LGGGGLQLLQFFWKKKIDREKITGTCVNKDLHAHKVPKPWVMKHQYPF